jgi:hypothetical protein
MMVKKPTVSTRVFEMWHKLPLKAIFIVVLILAALHVYFIDGFDYGTHGITNISINIPGGGHISLPGTFEVKVEDDEEYIAFCMAVKDQSQDLREFFIHHYHHIGIRRFYIMDDGSDPPLSSVADYGIPKSAISFHYYNASDHVGLMQLNIYNQCNEWYGKNHTWIGYFDADEFLEILSPSESLLSILKGFEKNDAIGAFGPNWRMHTSSDLQTRPESTRKAFTTCIYDDEENNGEGSDNKHVKSIVRTSKYKDAINPHMFNLKDGAHTVGEDGKYIEHWAFRQPITRNRVALHHYAVKSWEEYEAKMNRSNAMGHAKGMEFWDHVKDIPHVDCPEMAKYNP